MQLLSCFFTTMKAYQKEFPDIPIGYSGHESGTTITLGAIALGAKVVERHITMDKTWKGSDHEASLGRCKSSLFFLLVVTYVKCFSIFEPF